MRTTDPGDANPATLAAHAEQDRQLEIAQQTLQLEGMLVATADVARQLADAGSPDAAQQAEEQSVIAEALTQLYFDEKTSEELETAINDTNCPEEIRKAAIEAVTQQYVQEGSTTDVARVYAAAESEGKESGHIFEALRTKAENEVKDLTEGRSESERAAIEQQVSNRIQSEANMAFAAYPGAKLAESLMAEGVSAELLSEISEHKEYFLPPYDDDFKDINSDPPAVLVAWRKTQNDNSAVVSPAAAVRPFALGGTLGPRVSLNSPGLTVSVVSRKSGPANAAPAAADPADNPGTTPGIGIVAPRASAPASAAGTATANATGSAPARPNSRPTRVTRIVTPGEKAKAAANNLKNQAKTAAKQAFEDKKSELKDTAAEHITMENAYKLGKWALKLSRARPLSFVGEAGRKKYQERQSRKNPPIPGDAQSRNARTSSRIPNYYERRWRKIGGKATLLALAAAGVAIASPDSVPDVMRVKPVVEAQKLVDGGINEGKKVFSDGKTFFNGGKDALKAPQTTNVAPKKQSERLDQSGTESSTEITESSSAVPTRDEVMAQLDAAGITDPQKREAMFLESQK